MHRFDRLKKIVGDAGITNLSMKTVLVVGVGGVGGYVVEGLVRSGIGRIIIVDADVVDETNINRQIIATSRNNNKYKTREWKKRIKLINKNASVNIINTYITPDNIELLFGEKYDYMIDACDTTRVKVELIKRCHENGIKLVSSMGTAKKLDATKLIITTLDKTNTDPLAKKVRHELGKDKDLMKDVVVVTSTEKAIDTKNMLGSSAFVPAVAGLYITNYIVRDVCEM